MVSRLIGGIIPTSAVLVSLALIIVATNVPAPSFITPAQAAGGNNYVIGVHDKIKVRVHQWQPARAELHEWEALTGEYAVSISGDVAIPLIGQVRAAGHTSNSLANEIAERLKAKIGLAVKPSAVVDVVSFRPIYLTGLVKNPGEYTYRPGLNVLKAVSLSGGLLQAATSPEVTEVVKLNGRRDMVNKQLQAVRLTIVRLEAEVQGQPEIKFESIASARLNSELVADETRLFIARRSGNETSLRALAALKKRYEQELETLENKIKVYERQMQLSQEQADKIAKLARRGISTANRKLQTARTVVQDQVILFNLYSERSRVNQAAAQNEISIIKLRNTAMTSSASELRNARAHEEVLQSQLAALDQELRNFGLLASDSDETELSVAYMVLRPSPTGTGQSKWIEANETTQLLPGDTIKVKRSAEMVAKEQRRALRRGLALLRQDRSKPQR